MNKKLSTKISYVTRENKKSSKTVTSWYWGPLGLRKKGDRNWTTVTNTGIIGYVYPTEY